MASQRQRRAPAIGIKAPFPDFIEPGLATSVESVPSGERWIHEIKFDGYRVQMHLVNETVTAYTRRDGVYLGRCKGDDLFYAGKVDHGFDKTSAAKLRKRLEPLRRKTQPYAKRIAHKGIWVEPKLLAEIEYRARSAEGKVRHPFFKGLREDL
ncbi:ATP dependent DNA ligase [Bradyrhizobium sp. CCBAU 11357]|uniref:ATP dependent DNA ligase n=1 Tax=Bradyrhizobium sp. CCBAU 11357 TaxID=1630808 RepID=UPI0023039575|nr:hypothetical protein [Bradyrhizobium sp. CCBAU 11357]MDA9497774.1 hypothetical protein [Bradyrhizobium sp. CCBAU 11357]